MKQQALVVLVKRARSAVWSVHFLMRTCSWLTLRHGCGYFEKIRVFKAGLRLNILAWNNTETTQRVVKCLSKISRQISLLKSYNRVFRAKRGEPWLHNLSPLSFVSKTINYSPKARACERHHHHHHQTATHFQDVLPFAHIIVSKSAEKRCERKIFSRYEI